MPRSVRLSSLQNLYRDMFNVKFSSLGGLLEQFLQILAVGTWLYIFILGGLTTTIISIYLLLYTKYRWIIGIYLCWIWIIDRHTPETGGRMIMWCRTWSWWKYKRNYYPIRFEKLPGVELDPKKNYLACAFPHGLISDGFVQSFGMEDEKNLFPYHTPYLPTVSMQFKVPFVRDFLLSMGAISASAKSIEYILSKPGGGCICALSPGGAREAYYCKPGSYRIYLKNRKGFVKLSLRCGAPLIPVISFGETDLYDQLETPLVRSIQEFLKKWTGVVPIIPLGRFLLFPHKRMIATVVGNPMEVPQIKDPTQKEIDEYHAKFVEKLTEMFEEQKYNYLEKPEDKKLIIE